MPIGVLDDHPWHAVSLDASLLGSEQYDGLAAWAESGRQVRPGVVPTAEPTRPPTDADVTRQLLRLWSDLGFAEVEALPEFVVTPACGLAGAPPRWARTALELAAGAARNVSVEQGRMDP